jgi:hypothetical protein
MRSIVGIFARPITAATLAIVALAGCSSSGTSDVGGSGGSSGTVLTGGDIGVTRTLTGSTMGSPNEDIAVTVVKVVLAPSSSEYGFGPGPGEQWVAVEVRIKNLSSGPYIDSPSDCVNAVDAANQSITADEDAPTSVGPQFADRVTLTAGSSVVGVVAFSVSNGDKLEKLQFVPEQGTGTDVGNWALG